MVDLTTHLRRALKKRWEKASDAEKKAAVTHASRSYWDNLGPDERSAEMKRRAKVRAKNRKKQSEKSTRPNP
jgi:hypothetical protein